MFEQLSSLHFKECCLLSISFMYLFFFKKAPRQGVSFLPVVIEGVVVAILTIHLFLAGVQCQQLTAFPNNVHYIRNIMNIAFSFLEVVFVFFTNIFIIWCL